MKQKNLIRLLAVCSLCLLAFWLCPQEADAGNIVIVLDAGHDDTHVGARGNGLLEENLNLQIALACKAELETYEGVTVRMIRETGPCPYGGTNGVGSSTKCNLRRTEYAQSVGATAYVSIHNNSSTNTAARGVSVYYPTTNYNYACGVNGEGLARSVINQLVTAGLNNRGISVRYSEDNTRYADGSLADYYGVIKNSKLRGFPGIIIEHAFISNASDAAQFLSTREKLNMLGVLDARGIASYYGLHKKEALDYSRISTTVKAQSGNTEYLVTAANIKGANNVQFAVWSTNGGQDDLDWYSASKDANGNWIASIPVWKHRTEGEYIVHTYINDRSIYAQQATFYVTGPSIGSVSLQEMNKNKGTFTMEARGATSGAQVVSVSMRVGTKSDGSDLKWIEPVKGNYGIYHFTVKNSDFAYAYGTYYVHTYVMDKNNIIKEVNSCRIDLECPQEELELTGTSVEAVWDAKLTNCRAGLSAVTVQMWPKDQTQDAAQSFQMKKAGTEWNGKINLGRLSAAGEYEVRVTGVVNSNKIELLQTTCQVPELLVESRGVIDDEKLMFDNSYMTVTTENRYSEDVVLQVNPWCDYHAIDIEINKDSSKIFSGILAYDLTVSGEAVSEPAVSAGAVDTTIVFKVPEWMRDKDLIVYKQAGDGSLVKLSGVVSEDKSRVVVQQEADGVFVLGALETRKLGDVDANGKVDIKDAQLVLKAALRIAALDEKALPYAEVDGVEGITIKDGQLILKAALRIIKLD